VDGITELANFATVLGTTSFEDNYTIESYLARANYDFDGKYLATLSFRRDGNSKFASDVRWASFYGVSAGWNIHKENFFDVKWVDQLKLRTSYGELGNDGGISFYAYQALYSLGNNNQNESGFRQSSLENKSLTWETGKNFDVAMEFGLFKGRLSGTVEYFNRVTDGLIFSVPQPSSNGGTTGGNFSIATNIGSLYNKGFEAQITGEVVRTKNFKYTATINATTFKNQITKMPPGQPLIQSGTKGYAVGRSIYDFYLREFYGVDEENGRSLYKTNTLTSNSKIIGTDTVTNVIAEANFRYTGTSSIPDFYGSMNNTFSYKGLSLSVLFTYQVGGQVFDSAYQSLMHGGNYGTALHVDALGRWQNPGDKTSIPRLDNSQITNLTGTSTRWLTDASYLQLNNVTLNYALPKNLLAKIKAKTANVFVSGENLALLSKRKGMDVSGSFNGTVGNDYNFNKIVSVGLSLGF
jgi:TonB-linked SusC/RagA family outer membrane protein